MRRLIALAATAIFTCALGATSASAAAPTIPLLTVSDVTLHSATLEADVNPQGNEPLYFFEYGTGNCSLVPDPCTATAGGEIPKGSTPVRVKAVVEGLSAGTTYHLRVVVINGEEEVKRDRTFMTYLPAQEFGPCPNDGLRKENPAAARIEYSSANLPDCRAFEQASPLDKGAGDLTGIVPYARAALDGKGVLFLSASGLPGGEGSQEMPSYLASRANGAWSTRGLLPPGGLGQNADLVGWTPNLEDIYTEATKLGEPAKTTFLQSQGAGTALRTIAGYTTNMEPRLAGTAAGGALVLFEAQVAVAGVAGALEGKSNLYLWERESGKLSLVGMLNDLQEPPGGTFAGPYDWVLGTNPTTLSKGGSTREYYTQDEHVIAADGSAVYFTAAGSGQLYVRLNPAEEQSKLDGEGNCTEPALACTVLVSASKRTVPDPGGTRPAAFMGASTDGSKSIFTSSEMLTDDANTGPEQEPAAIERADIDGKPESIKTKCVPTHATGVAVDGAHIYWANSVEGTIGRANLECGEVDNSFIVTGPGSPQYVAIDAGHIYWTNDAPGEEAGVYPPAEGGTIGRADINGENVKTDFITGASAPQGIAVNATHIYWANAPYPSAAIGRAEIDGKNADYKFHKLSVNEVPRGVAVDGAHLYWAININPVNGGFSIIRRTELDGSNEVSISPGKEEMRGIALDGKYVYWASQPERAIGRVDLNLSKASVERKFITADGAPDGVAVDSAHIYWAVNGNSPPNPGNDLYRYDAKTKALSDLAPDHGDVNGAEVRGVLGASQDGSYVYFAANGVPDGVTGSPNGRGENAEAGSCPSELGSPTKDNCNLYLAHNGEVEFIARLESGGTELETDDANWAATPTGVFPGQNFQTAARVSADGQTLLFRSQRQLTDYPNEGKSQLYRYQAGDSEVSCVSCNPTGMAPAKVGQARFGVIAPSVIIPKEVASVLSRNLSADGNRVFFETTDALVGNDTNGKVKCPPVGAALQSFPACTDVYEWEAEGTGSCDSVHAVAGGGCLYLLSTGKGTEPALIVDASADGKDVFFVSRSRLVGQDEDSLLDVYDASQEGGLAAQNEPAAVICEGEGCKPAASAPPQIPSPPKFSGPPNPKAGCAKGKHKVKGRCVAKQGKGKGQKQHKHKQGKRRASAGREAGR